MTRRDAATWALLVGVPVAYEFRQLGRGDLGVPLSTVIRAAFRTEHPAGALVFALAVDVGARWLTRHILSEGEPTLAS